MITNISDDSIPSVAELFHLIGQPARIQILFVLSCGEACVCHLEAYLGLRQAAISQHLIILRKAGLVTANRDGRNIYYQLAQPGIMTLVNDAVRLIGLDPDEIASIHSQPVVPCPCPHCNPDKDPHLDCSSLHVIP